MRPQTLHGCFVTGTAVRKAHVSVALLHWSGWRSAGLKPVAASTVPIDGQPVNEDCQLDTAARQKVFDRIPFDPTLFT